MKSFVLLILVCAVTVITGCSVTQKEERQAVQADRAELAAKLAASQDTTETLKFLETLLNELRLGHYSRQVDVERTVQYQTQPAPQYAPQYVQPSAAPVVVVPAPQQPRVIYMQPQQQLPGAYPYPFLPSAPACGCQLQSTQAGNPYCPCPVTGEAFIQGEKQ